MAGKNYGNLALESVFGQAPASGWRGQRILDDGHQARVLVEMSEAIVYGETAPSTDGVTSTPRGATGTITEYLSTNGMGLLLKAGFSTSVITTPVGATDARLHTHAMTDVASSESFAFQVQREYKGGGVGHDTYTGGQIGELKISQETAPEGGGETSATKAKISATVDYAGLVRGDTQRLPTYVSPGLELGVGQCKLYIAEAFDEDGDPIDMDDDLVEECFNKFEITIPHGLNFNDPCISGGLSRDKATMAGLRKPTIALGWTPKNETLYNAYLAGTWMAFKAVWEAPAAMEIEDGFVPSITLKVPAFKFTGSTPQMSRENVTTQDLPGAIHWNGVAPSVSLERITTDTAF
jgi:hypothetical protein